MEKLKKAIKWFGNISVFIYAAIMFFGNIAMTMIVTELGAGTMPILYFNGIMVSAYLTGILSRYIK